MILHPIDFLKRLCQGIKRIIATFYKLLYISLPILLLIIGILFLIFQWSNMNKDFGLSKYISDHSKDCKFIENHCYFPTDEEIYFDNGKKNLVIIMGESLEETFNDSDIPGGPLLSRCAEEAKKGQSMSNFYSPGDCGWTISALTAWSFGLPLKTPLPIDGNSYNSKKGFLPNAKSIFDILDRSGYELVLVMGSNSHYSGIGGLFSHSHFCILDRRYWEENGYTQEIYKGTGWGYNDKFVLERAKEEYVKLCKGDKPFLLFVQTIDTHVPCGFCKKEEIKFGDIRDAYIYVDKIIASFVHNIVTDDKTVVALIGDHCLMGGKYHKWMPSSKDNHKSHRLFNAFWGDIPSFTDKKIIAPYDIAPTLLEASGARWSNRRYGLGVSFFSDEHSLIEEIGIDQMYDSISRFSKFYERLY